MRPTKTIFSVGKGKMSSFFQLIFGRYNSQSIRVLLVTLISLGSFMADAHAGNAFDTWNCGESCFHAEILKKEKVDNCYNYTIKVNHDGSCKHALSHLMIDMPCGTITEASNSEGWPMELNVYDYKTKLYGFKVDDIVDFGESDDPQSFTVDFTICGESTQCQDMLSCWNPKLGYKAGYCVHYETLIHNTPDVPDLEAVINSSDVTCQAGNDGTATVDVVSGEEPVTFLWSNGATTNHIEGLVAGTYEVTVTDANGNELLLSTTVSEPEGMTLTEVASPASCNGFADGGIDLSVSGGSAPYTYSWSNGATTEDIENIGGGFYSVTVTDAEGCSKEALIEVPNSIEFIVFANITHASCAGRANGKIDITVDGGEGPYTYEWSNGETTEDIDGLSGGFYTVTVTDANGCSIIRAYQILENNEIFVDAQVTNTGCNDDGTGAIDITINGGEAPYSVVWSNDATTEDIDGLNAGSYTAYITDNSGCTTSVSATVGQESLEADFEITSPTCVGGNDGQIILSVTNGEAPYTYTWSNEADTKDLENIGSGLYSVTITDAAQCSVTKMVYLPEPLPIQISGQINYASCNSETSNASIDIEVSGGTAPYTYDWSTGETTEDISDVAPGSYVVTVTDANQCQNLTIFEVTEAPVSDLSCLINMPTTTPVCSSTGNLLTANAGNAVSFSWDIVSSDNSWSIETGGEGDQIRYTAGNEGSEATFYLTVTDELGCQQTCEMTLTSCTPDNNGGGEEPCEDCFSSQIIEKYRFPGCVKYEITVSTNGNCDKELSHYTVAVPCGNVQYLNNSEGWPVEANILDPTTGLYGFKIDDIDGFGKTPDSFTVSFKICSPDMECISELDNWTPKVAYKAGLCVSYEELNLNGEEPDNDDPVSVYPNPCVDYAKINWTCKETDYTVVDVCNTKGEVVSTLWKGTCYKGKKYNFLFEGRKHKKDLYIYRIRNSKKSFSGKIYNTR